MTALPGELPNMPLLASFALGSVTMRAAGCIANDFFDRDFDKKVERTKNRPLACGQISPRNALVYLAAHLAVSLPILLQFNMFSIGVGVASLGLAGIYPLTKRFTHFPQAFLGMAFSFGVPLGWAASTGGFAPYFDPLCLYLGGICWTLVYDTIYAHQDIRDDIKAGIKSTAIIWKETTPQWLAIFASLMLLALSGVGVLSHLQWPYFASVAVTGCHLAWQICFVNLKDPKSCAFMFQSNKWIGLIIFSGIVASKLFKGSDFDASVPLPN